MLILLIFYLFDKIFLLIFSILTSVLILFGLIPEFSGYMAPEYLMFGNLSVRADVFSFGVVILELISGQRNSSFNLPADAENLLDWVRMNSKSFVVHEDNYYTNMCLLSSDAESIIPMSHQENCYTKICSSVQLTNGSLSK